MITPMISTAVYLDVIGTERNAGGIVALGAGTRNGKFQVGVQIKATGNVRLRPSGTIRLMNDQWQPVSVYSLVEGNPIFPGQVRDYPASGPDNTPATGHYTLSSEIRSGTLELKVDQGIFVKPSGEVEIDRKKEKEEKKASGDQNEHKHDNDPPAEDLVTSIEDARLDKVNRECKTLIKTGGSDLHLQAGSTPRRHDRVGHQEK